VGQDSQLRETARWQGHLIPIRVYCFYDVPSQVRIAILLEVLSSVRSDFRRFWAVFFNFGRFLRVYVPKTHLLSRFLVGTEHCLKSALVLYRCSPRHPPRFQLLGC